MTRAFRVRGPPRISLVDCHLSGAGLVIAGLEPAAYPPASLTSSATTASARTTRS